MLLKKMKQRMNNSNNYNEFDNELQKTSFQKKKKINLINKY